MTGHPFIKRCFAIAALLILLISGAVSVYSFWINHKAPLSEHSVDVDFSRDYPFQDAEETLKATPNASSRLLNAYREKADFLTSALTDYAGQQSLLYPAYTRVFGKINALLGKERVEDSEEYIYKLLNGSLTVLKPYAETAAIFQKIGDFHDWLSERGIDSLYVIPPNKADETQARFPFTVEKGYGRMETDFAAFLREQNADVLLGKQLLLEENSDFYGWFYLTDHHWNVRAGRLAAQRIAEALALRGFNADPSRLDITFFTSETYENLFLGSYGKKAKLGYAEPEDFEILLPVYETSFRVEIPTLGYDETGSFSDVLLDRSCLTSGSLYTQSVYGTLMHNDRPLIRVTNMNAEGELRVLILKESKANAVTPYLACAVKHLDIIDPRYFNGSIRSYIEQTEPDIVIFLACGPSGDSDTVFWSMR